MNYLETLLDAAKPDTILHGILRDAMDDRGIREAAKTWLSKHDLVSTRQATIRDGKIVSYWDAGYREVTCHSTYATFDGSRRDFAGLTWLASDRDYWIGLDESMSTVVIYAVA